MKTLKPLIGTLAITAALVAQVQAQSSLTNGLVAYYPFNGDANDASGWGNNGTNSGATDAEDRFGMPAHSFHFDRISNIDANVTVPWASNLWGFTEFSVSAWVKCDGIVMP